MDAIKSLEKSFGKYFAYKGDVAPIAEKAAKNFEEKYKHAANREERVHYFAVGHAFRQLDTETIFGFVPNSDQSRKEPSRFLALRKEQFFIIDNKLPKVPEVKGIKSLLQTIRNINSHYVHDFDKIETGTIRNELIAFLIESFELSAIVALCTRMMNAAPF